MVHFLALEIQLRVKSLTGEIEEYFDSYDMIDDQRVGFAKMKLVGLAKV